MAAITDQSTSELRVNLRARREWAQTAIGWRRRDALREIREMEDELEARGESPEAEAPERAKAPQPTGYYTPQRLKMHTVDTAPDDDPQLCYHEDRGDGLPLCGQPLNPWTDENGVLREVEWAPRPAIRSRRYRPCFTVCDGLPGGRLAVACSIRLWLATGGWSGVDRDGA
jgi:hypothetical protein